MAKVKTSTKQKTASESTVTVNRKLLKKREPLVALLDKDKICAAIKECLSENDFAGIIEIVQIYLKAKKRAAKPEDHEQATSNCEVNQWQERTTTAAAKIASGEHSRTVKKIL